jgi:uncharacterized protein (TIRG00374 family)
MKKYRSPAIKLIVTVAIFCLIFRRFDINLSAIFDDIQWVPYILAGVFIRLVIMPIIFISRWKLFLRHSGIEERFFSLVKIGFLSSFFGIVLPSSQGNDLMRMIFIEKKHSNSNLENTSSSSVLIERMLGIALLAITGLISSILVPSFPRKEQVVILISLISICIACIILVLTNKRLYRIVSGLMSRIRVLKKVTGFIDKTHFSIVTFPYKKIFFPALILTLLLQLCTITIVFLVFRSFGVDLPYYQHMSFYPIITILSVLPVAISGLGLREGLFVYFYALTGVSPQLAVGVSLINYVVEVLTAASVGGILFWFGTKK